MVKRKIFGAKLLWWGESSGDRATYLYVSFKSDISGGFDRLFRLISAIEINPGEYSGRINGDDTIDKWYKFERPNTYFNQIKEQVKQHVSTLESFESLDQPL